MLTGESIPVMKSSIPIVSKEVYSDTESAKHTLYSGTGVIQTRQVGNEPVLGLVKSTGFLTTKGTLIRDILYPKEIKFKFYADGMKFIAIMALLAILAQCITLPIQISEGVPVQILIFRTLDLLTITVPPALPAAMSCGIVFAISRLKRQDIFCISPPRVNMAGQIQNFVFDKTGTLTEEGLSVLGFRPTAAAQYESHNKGVIEQTIFTEFQGDPKRLKVVENDQPWWLGQNTDHNRNLNTTLFLEAMASCTAVTYVEGELVGDPLDVKMFEKTGWMLDETDQSVVSASGEDQLVIAYVYPQEQKHYEIQNVGYGSMSSSEAENNGRTSSKPYKSALIRRFDFSS